MENMKIYNAVAVVPQEALKDISAGRLKGMSDINPMWRIKTLTEQFGACGFGWWYVIKSQRLEKGIDEISAFVDIDLYIKVDGEVSQPIPGVGGSSFLTKESSGRMYQSDECFKMALTDALGIACKAIGMAGKVYYAKDRSKYDQPPTETPKATPKQDIPKVVPVTYITDDQAVSVANQCSETESNIKEVMQYFSITTLDKMTAEQFAKFEKMMVKKREQKTEA